MQFSSRFSVLFHLPLPIVLFDGIQQSSQFATLFWGELVNGCFDLFHATHVRNLSASQASDKRGSNFHKHEVFARRVTMFQIAIAIAAISALTKKRPFWIVSLLFGAAGCAFLVLAAIVR